MKLHAAGAALAVVTLFSAVPASAQQAADMTFFVTSTPIGNGADLGGLEGADKHCQTLAQAVGAGSKTWHAYLSTQGAGAVNARDRIGKGPWKNIKGETIATSVDDLHSDKNNLNLQTALSEKATVVQSRDNPPNMHDILTGSDAQGRAFTTAEDRTCKNWTSSTEGSAMLGHVDRRGTGDPATNASWNAAHGSRGCTQDGLKATGGNGLLYCFAVN
ncbi:MAG: C-type lectin-like protein [Hyphomicrobiales bacterium]|jgi:hypothetical protein|nr:C-type lectin-like protein [Hyphomicrobiales bacterium]